MTENIQALSNLLEKYRELLVYAEKEKIKGHSDLLARFVKFQSEISRAEPKPINLFGLFGVSEDELVHSSILAWLLDGQSSHTLGSIFFHNMCLAAGIDTLPITITKYSVRTEFARTASRIDIMVYSTGQFIVYIENKIGSDEEERQLEREFNDLRQLGIVLRVPPDKQFGIFLTPDGRKPTTGDPSFWKEVSYSKLASAFEPLKTQINDVKSQLIFADWLDIIKSLGG